MAGPQPQTQSINNNANNCTYCEQEIKLGGRFYEDPPIMIKDPSRDCSGSLYNGQIKSRTLTRTYKPLNDLVHLRNNLSNDLVDSYRIPKVGGVESINNRL